MKRIIVLGSTGSIGTSTLDVVRNRRDLFRVVGLSAHTQSDVLLEQAREFGVSALALSGSAGRIPERVRYHGEAGLLEMIRETEAEIVVNGVAGAKGLLPSVAALESGKDLALANKETMVMAGALVRALAERRGRAIVPVDSEHSGVFHLLRGRDRSTVEEIVLTASGGAFRDRSAGELAHVTPAEALAHPTWKMGAKITIDSATMANKGLEVIEAFELFGLPLERITVLIHPQSSVHALVRTLDGSLYAQIGSPDMRVPIQNALTYPQTVPCPFGRLELAGRTLTFFEPDAVKYRMLPLAYRAAGAGGTAPLAYNAANEVAVQAFVDGRIRYLEIPRMVERVLEAETHPAAESFEEVLERDREVRRTAERMIASGL